ncbi:MAG: 30S ribosomal protein S6 [Chloroflexi bacterium]|nr:30S ribosomal protein S6 [Chloroflexota bacterium]
MRTYELMVVLDPNLDEAGVEAFNQRLATLVAQRGGTIVDSEPWGRRRLAYPIGRFRDGIYILSHLRLETGATAELERALKLNENVIRHLLVRYEPSATTAAATEPAAA